MNSYIAKKNYSNVAERTEKFEGPLPSPEILEKYNVIVPGAAERILKMAEDQASLRQNHELEVTLHRRKSERKSIGSRSFFRVLARGVGSIIDVGATNYKGLSVSPTSVSDVEALKNGWIQVGSDIATSIRVFKGG